MAKARPENVRFASAWLAAEEDAGRQHGPALLALGTGLWRSEMYRAPDFRRYGTLKHVLDVIHDELYDHPIQARERAAVVVEFVETIDVPTAHYHAFLGGYGWKVYANALRYAAEFPAALKAARYSQTLFRRVGSLEVEAAKARLVEALILREVTSDKNEVLRIAKECAEVFRDHEDAQAYMHARMTEALVLADSGRHRDAIAILESTAGDAEQRGDKRTLAICLHNSAEYARALGDRGTARQLDARALKHFEELGTSVEKPSIRWTEALALADEGQSSAAILQLRMARSEFLTLGMNGSAADCGLDIVRLKCARGQDVTTECVELIETLTRAGMIQPAIEALAYLREQSRDKTISESTIEHVRKYVREAAKSQHPRQFVPPFEEDGA